jgi:hypothetical protein
MDLFSVVDAGPRWRMFSSSVPHVLYTENATHPLHDVFGFLRSRNRACAQHSVVLLSYLFLLPLTSGVVRPVDLVTRRKLTR